MTALMSTGGWYLVSGDEFALPGRRLVWKEHKLLETFKKKWGASADYDFRDFICQINHFLEKLPEPTECFWADSIFLRKHPNLIIQALHHDAPGFEGDTSVVFINLGSSQVTLCEQQIADMTRVLHYSHKVEPGKVIDRFLQAMKKPEQFYILGPVELKDLPQYQPTRITDSYKERRQKYPISLLDSLSEQKESSQLKLT